MSSSEGIAREVEARVRAHRVGCERHGGTRTRAGDPTAAWEAGALDELLAGSALAGDANITDACSRSSAAAVSISAWTRSAGSGWPP